jgi:hypothetical protein
MQEDVRADVVAIRANAAKKWCRISIKADNDNSNSAHMIAPPFCSSVLRQPIVESWRNT